MALIVASCRRPDALATLLRSIRAQTLPPSEYEVSIVVDGTGDGEQEYRRILEAERARGGAPLRYAFQPNAGQSAARHRAIAATSAPWVCIVDDDMEAAPEFLAEHLGALAAGGEQTVAIGRVLPEEGWEGGPLHEAVRTKGMLELHDALASGARAPTGFAFVTQNVCLSRALFERVGGFDESLRLGEDTELGLRLERAGARFVFVPGGAAVHRSRVGSYEVWLRRCIQYGRNAVYAFEKLDGDPRAHPLRNLVNGSRLNAGAVHLLCRTDRAAMDGIAALRVCGEALRKLGLVGLAIATHKAILAVAFHLGVKQAFGSWRRLLEAKREFTSMPGAPTDPT